MFLFYRKIILLQLSTSEQYNVSLYCCHFHARTIGGSSDVAHSHTVDTILGDCVPRVKTV